MKYHNLNTLSLCFIDVDLTVHLTPSEFECVVTDLVPLALITKLSEKDKGVKR